MGLLTFAELAGMGQAVAMAPRAVTAPSGPMRLATQARGYVSPTFEKVRSLRTTTKPTAQRPFALRATPASRATPPVARPVAPVRKSATSPRPPAAPKKSWYQRAYDSAAQFAYETYWGVVRSAIQSEKAKPIRYKDAKASYELRDQPGVLEAYKSLNEDQRSALFNMMVDQKAGEMLSTGQMYFGR